MLRRLAALVVAVPLLLGVVSASCATAVTTAVPELWFSIQTQITWL